MVIPLAVPRRFLAVLLALLLAPLAFAMLLILPHDATTKEGFVPETRLTGHVVGHAYWAALAAALATYLYRTRKPRALGQALREDPGACIAFAGLCLLVVGQVAEMGGAATMGYSTDDRWHDLGIIAIVGPAEAIILIGLLVWGAHLVVRRLRRRATPQPT